MNTHLDAGRLNEPVTILDFREVSEGVWDWTPCRRAWAQIDLQPKTNLFSKVGIGARDVAMVIRRQSISLHQAVDWHGRRLFLTAVTERNRNLLDVDAALVTMTQCKAKRTADTMGPGNRPQTADVLALSFPAVLTEKYAKYQREETFDAAETAYVLVTPKAILLEEGDLVTVTEGPAAGVYHLTVRHVLDEYKNEYEIVRRGDI